MTKCIHCGSLQLARFRLDSDWAVGCGDFYPINAEENYTEDQLEYFNKSYRPDIECLYCFNCSQVQEG